ncbi:MAG TPA: S41 family peptidase, partial [Bdellovibrionales bacterium]|nr:S41 family peptidase [Bdellovibrionales bacterium]
MNRAGVFRILIFLFFSATFVIATSAQEEKPLAEHWKRTGLKARNLEALVEDKACRKSDRTFMSCVSLLSAMIPSGTRLVPFDPELGEEIVRRVGVAAVVKEEPVAPAGASELLRKVKEKRENTRSRWLKLKGSKSLSFATIFAELRAGLEASIFESETSAKAFNAYLEVFNDPHTYILPTAYVMRESQTKQESFIGIGIQLGRLGSYPIIQSLLSGGPAAKAGIRRNDLILSIDGQSTGGLSLEEASKKLKGGPGTTVSLLLWRDTRPVAVEVRRDELKKTNVETQSLNTAGIRLKYIRVGSFMRSDLCNDVMQALMEISDEQGIVLDLRDNGGGLVDGAICLASVFLPSGKTVVRVKELADGNTQAYKARGGALTNLPVTVLVNSGSASASEIVAGALQ